MKSKAARSEPHIEDLESPDLIPMVVSPAQRLGQVGLGSYGPFLGCSWRGVTQVIQSQTGPRDQPECLIGGLKLGGWRCEARLCQSLQ